MFREIKFRGNSGGKWVYGCLNKTYHLEYCPAILKDYDDNSEYEVDINSIGQYTGLKDKSGTEIYEGDIVIINGNSDDIGRIYYDDYELAFAIDFMITQSL